MIIVPSSSLLMTTYLVNLIDGYGKGGMSPIEKLVSTYKYFVTCRLGLLNRLCSLAEIELHSGYAHCDTLHRLLLKLSVRKRKDEGVENGNGKTCRSFYTHTANL